MADYKLFIDGLLGDMTMTRSGSANRIGLAVIAAWVALVSLVSTLANWPTPCRAFCDSELSGSAFWSLYFSLAGAISIAGAVLVLANRIKIGVMAIAFALVVVPTDVVDDGVHGTPST